MASITLGRIDLKIFQVLQENSRLTNVELSGWVALSSSPCLRRLRQFEDTGIIRKYVAPLFPVIVELGPQASIRISTNKVKVIREEFSAAVRTWSEVLSRFALASEIDYLLHVFFIDMNAFSYFVLDMLFSHEGVQNAQSSPVLKEIENTTVLPLTHLQRD